MRHRQRIDDGLLELFDDVVKTADGVEADGDVFGCNDLQGDLVLVLVENEPLQPGCVPGPVGAIAAFGIFVNLPPPYPLQVCLCF
jgi:hypothetical protein